jgi:hypothetical protein
LQGQSSPQPGDAAELDRRIARADRLGHHLSRVNLSVQSAPALSQPIQRMKRRELTQGQRSWKRQKPAKGEVQRSDSESSSSDSQSASSSSDSESGSSSSDSESGSSSSDSESGSSSSDSEDSGYEADREPAKRRLLLGEANLSFAKALVQKHPKLADSLIATTYEPGTALATAHPDYKRNKEAIVKAGGQVMHGVDATALEKKPALKEFRYPRIHFNFPRVPAKGRNTNSQQLIKSSFASFRKVQKKGERVHMALPTKGAYEKPETRERLYGLKSAKANKYKFVGKRKNPLERYDKQGYKHLKTGKAKSAAAADTAREYIFERVSSDEDPEVFNSSAFETSSGSMSDLDSETSDDSEKSDESEQSDDSDDSEESE